MTGLREGKRNGNVKMNRRGSFEKRYYFSGDRMFDKTYLRIDDYILCI